MSNFVNFVKKEHVVKLGITFMIAYSTQNLLKSIIEHYSKKFGFEDKPIYKNFVTVIFVLVFSYILSKMLNLSV